MAIIKKQDSRIYGVQSVSTVPAGVGGWTEANVTLLAGAAVTFQVTTTPDSAVLALWNFLLSIYVDLPGSGGGGPNLLTDLQYIFPAPVAASGVSSLLTAAQRNLTLMQWLDWAQSSDLSNIRVHNIRIVNNDSGTHLYTLRYKAYTITRAAGN